jgi:hypothetical protein
VCIVREFCETLSTHETFQANQIVLTKTSETVTN